MDIKTTVTIDAIKQLHSANIEMETHINKNQEKIKKLWIKLGNEPETKLKGKWKGDGIPEDVIEQLKEAL